MSSTTPAEVVAAQSSWASEMPAGSRRSPRGVLETPNAAIRISAIFVTFWVPLLAIALRLASSGTGNIAYIVAAGYALTGPRQSIVALFLTWFFNVINHGIAPAAGYAAFLRHVITLCAFVGAIAHSNRRIRQAGSLVPATAILCGFLVIHSLLFSQQIDISLLKSISFSMTAMALVLNWASLGERDRALTQAFLFGMLGVIAIASIPFVASSIGYFRNGRGFQGIQVHPQGFGPTMAVLAALLISQSLTERRIRLWKGLLATLAMAWVYLSLARIGALALVAGVTFGAVGEAIRGWFSTLPARNAVRRGRLIGFGSLALLAALIASPWIADNVWEFVAKGSKAESAVEAALKSRGNKIDAMMQNIDQHPVWGIGFGAVEGEDYFGLVRDPVFGLPVMATIEKGVLPIAIIEETGIVGALFTYPWLFLLIVRSIRGGLVSGTVSAAVLVTNVAEASLFSPGGQGLFQLLFAIWAATAPPIVAPRATATRGRSRLAA
jgi:hypothetical protein